MKKILGSVLVVLAVLAGGVGASRAFFSDTETSNDNVFQAGTIDLKVDNTSYYNGVLSPNTTWLPDDLPGHLFFNFNDLKPSDKGEDTISLHVNDNEAWACMSINLTKNDDNTCTEPENVDDPTCNEPNQDLTDGELAQNVNFVFWIDDGDNVLEDNETITSNILAQGPAAQIMNGTSWALADSVTNHFGEAAGQGLHPQNTYYIGKAWCFGNLALAPLTQDNANNVRTPANTTGGITCDGSLLNNATQTDIMMADVSFQAIQSRNNANFICGDEPSHSPSPTPGLCEKKPDVMLVLDRSGSISAGELTTLKNASNAFINALNLSATTAHSGQSSFATLGSLDLQLTDNPVLAHNAVNALSTGGFTNLFQGLSLADDELASIRDRADGTSPDFMVVVTDGEPNEPGSDANARAVASAEAADARSHGVTIYVVGIGVTPGNATYLQNNIASPGAGHYFNAANFTDLEAILMDIANCPR